MTRNRFVSALFAAFVLVPSACRENGQLEATTHARAMMSIAATSGHAGEHVDVALVYLRQPSVHVPMLTQTFPITVNGDQLFSLSVDLTDCLADAQHVATQANSCSVFGALVLRSSTGEQLDSTSIGPLVVTVGATAPASATLTSAATVVVTAANPMFIGDTFNAQAVVRDRDNVNLVRPVTWSSSNATVATVSAAGVITAVSAGSTIITATCQGITGTANITVQPNATVVSIVPTSVAVEVSIDTPIQVTMSENVNASTVTATSITLTQNGSPITVNRSVAGAVVTLTPTVSLTEFNTTYLVTVSPSLKTVSGNHLAVNATGTFITGFWDNNYYYRLNVNSRGLGESLDTFNGSPFNCFMGATGAFTGQGWYFTPIPSVPSYYAMHNLLGLESSGLEGATAPAACFLLGPPFTPGQFSGTVWHAVSAGALAPGRYYLQNLNFGAARSLEAHVDVSTPVPQMLPTANAAAQFWLFTRLSHR